MLKIIPTVVHIMYDVYDVCMQEEGGGDEQQTDEDACPLSLNAFDMIILSQRLNLSSMFDRGQGLNSIYPTPPTNLEYMHAIANSFSKLYVET